MGNFCATNIAGEGEECTLCDDCYIGVDSEAKIETFEECEECKTKDNKEKMYCEKCAVKLQICQQCGKSVDDDGDDDDDSDENTGTDGVDEERRESSDDDDDAVEQNIEV